MTTQTPEHKLTQLNWSRKNLTQEIENLQEAVCDLIQTPNFVFTSEQKKEETEHLDWIIAKAEGLKRYFNHK